MPDFVDNTAGYSEVTGTADYLMTTTGTGLHLRLDQALVDAQEVAYYAVGTSNGVDAFESGTATWDDSENTLVVDTITNSSNGGGKISWDAGDKTIYIVANSATMVNTADPRLVSEDVDDLTPATYVDGTEKAAFSQGGAPVSLTPEQIAGSPITMQMSHARDKNRSFTNFSALSPTYNSGIVSGVAMDLEPFLIYTSGTDATVFNARLVFNNPYVLSSTGSTTTGRACIAHKDAPLLSNAGSRDFDCRQTVVQAPPLTGNEFIAQFGFINSVPEIAVFGSHRGVFFELTVASLNWQARWISATAGVINNRTVDTGVAPDGVVPQTLRVHLRSHPTDVAERKADFYIDGELVASIPYNPGGGVAAMPDNTALTCAYVVKKSTGTTGAGPAIFGHNSNFSVVDQTLYEHL